MVLSPIPPLRFGLRDLSPTPSDLTKPNPFIVLPMLVSELTGRSTLTYAMSRLSQTRGELDLHAR
jgi:hypothetical protein